MRRITAIVTQNGTQDARMSQHTYRRKEKAEGTCPDTVWRLDARTSAGGAKQKPGTVLKAAELADDFVLTHKGAVGGIYPAKPKPVGNDYEPQLPSFRPSRPLRDASRCNYCQASGHWKKQCPMLKFRNRSKSFLPSAPALSCTIDKSYEAVDKDFAPFIHDAYVSLVGGEQRVPIKLLRDTGAKQSFIVESVLPFSSATETGECVLMHGMELGVIPVPRHTVMLDSEFVQGPVIVGVRPALPLPSVSLILGNDLVGSRVWPTAPLPVVTAKPHASQSGEELCPEIFPACAITRAQSRAVVADGAVKNESFPSLPALPAAFSLEEWGSGQKADPSLSVLFENLLSGVQVQSAAHGYFLQDGLLMRKWVPCYGDVVGEPTFQFVVPEKLREEFQAPGTLVVEQRGWNGTVLVTVSLL
ncbi:hypothetical protein WMY93_020547 [Mugilogobius chulae]|uniref:CCHC-type domain-containing protein n=1 Tax=Mugilogobius chulae TaxID=88201 RepID=A0AAW0N861_9GOBI